MKSVLLVIKQKWCELIASGIKTIDMRKSAPNLKTPFKCFIYKSKSKVIGEFVCDKIEEIKPCFEYYSDGYDLNDDMLAETCLTRKELMHYGKGATLYGWYISDLKLYDEPKDLREFKRECKQYWLEEPDCENCEYESDDVFNDCKCEGLKPLTRPPYSWCYVEAV